MEEIKDYTLQDYLEYRKMLEEYVSERSDIVFLNDSRVHAVMVLTAMLTQLKTAEKREDRLLKMFCGEFSLFRDTTKRHLSVLEKEYESEFKAENMSWADFDPYGKLQQALESFFKNQGRLELIVTSNPLPMKDEDSWEFFSNAIQTGRMQVWQYSNDFCLDHFSVAGSAYRIENSDEEKTAICCFNDAPTARKLAESFDSIKGNSRRVLTA